MSELTVASLFIDLFLQSTVLSKFLQSFYSPFSTATAALTPAEAMQSRNIGPQIENLAYEYIARQENIVYIRTIRPVFVYYNRPISVCIKLKLISLTLETLLSSRRTKSHFNANHVFLDSDTAAGT